MMSGLKCSMLKDILSKPILYKIVSISFCINLDKVQRTK